MSRKRSTGWEAYRHGPSDPPPKKYPPIVNKDKRKNLIDRIFDAMADWRFSPWQFEGVTRSHLRSALCLQGYGWGRSDAEAAAILAEVLKGYQRPSWQEGQPSYTASIVTCKACGGPLDEYEISHGIRFCCEECQRIGKLKSTGLAAGFIETGPRECENPSCRTVFYPREAFQRFCSLQCSVEGRGLVLSMRNCATCGEEFQPSHETSLYCSDRCNNRAKVRRKGERRREARQDQTCLHCRSIFTPKKAGAKFCSERCQKNASYHRLKAAKAAAASDHPIHRLFDDAA